MDNEEVMAPEMEETTEAEEVSEETTEEAE